LVLSARPTASHRIQSPHFLAGGLGAPAGESGKNASGNFGPAGT